MNTAIILVLSGILIGAGLAVVWRDIRSSRRRGFVSEREVPPEFVPEAEITIQHGSSARAPAVAPPADEPTVPGDAGRARTIDTKQTSLELQWAGLAPVIAAGIERVNAVLGPAQLAIGTTGEPTWSYKNRGYGAFRRLLLAEESIAWLRLEVSADGRLHANVKSHKDDRAAINATADAPAKGMTAAGISDLLSQCVKPAVTLAAGAGAPPRDDAQQASDAAWRSIEPTVTAALKATNGALSQAGARLVTVAAANWEPELRHHRLTLGVEVLGEDVARMHIEQLAHEMEVAVGLRDATLAELGRRRRIPIEGMTVHALAELIAGCAWPTIARFRDVRRSA